MKMIQIAIILSIIACGRQKDPNSSVISEVEEAASAELVSQAEEPFLIGTGITDITGPAAGVVLFGYVDMDQVASGIHTRQFARSFITVDRATGQRAAFVISDLCHITQAIEMAVMDALKEKYGNLYTHENVQLGATHTHAGPGGYSHYKLYNAIVKGYNPKYFAELRDALVNVIVKAHESLQPGHLEFAQKELVGASINRSIDAYRQNPKEERARYAQDTDSTMSLLKLVNHAGEAIGAFSWFAVHNTSMESDSSVISSDNKGAAALFFEDAMGTDHLRGKGFVAGFFNSNAGDSSPNTAKDVDGDNDWDCELLDNRACTRLSGNLQLQKARELFDGPTTLIRGPIDHRHRYADFSRIQVQPEFTNTGRSEKTCPSAVGLAVTAGSKEDGPGINFPEGMSCTNVKNSFFGKRVFCTVTHDECQGAKPVVLNDGKFNPPWTPEVLPVQLIRIGTLAFIAVPAEFTTMSGRRLRETVAKILEPSGVEHVILTGYANAYSGYVTTREEYQIQHYEGASTHFGEWTLAAYQQEFAGLAEALRDGVPGPASLQPRRLDGSFPTTKEEVSDVLPEKVDFGAEALAPEKNYVSNDVVSASFWAADPSHDSMRGRSFVEVQRLGDSRWYPVAFDFDWSTLMTYIPPEKKKAGQMRIEWKVPEGAAAGQYRMLLRGVAIDENGKPREYEGYSTAFEVR